MKTSVVCVIALGLYVCIAIVAFEVTRVRSRVDILETKAVCPAEAGVVPEETEERPLWPVEM